VHWASGIPHALFGRKINASLGRIAPRDRGLIAAQSSSSNASYIIQMSVF
jgi:hypothetical protein